MSAGHPEKLNPEFLADEKGPDGSFDREKLDSESSHDDLEKDVEQDRLRRTASNCLRSKTRSRSRPGSTRLALHSSRSFVDGHSTYFSDNGDQDDEPDVEASADPDRAFEVRWDGHGDPTDPRNMSSARRWFIVWTISASSLCVSCTSSLYTMTYDQLTREFHCSTLIATLGLSLFVMGLGLGPMLLAPLSEFYGRRPIYIASLTAFTIWKIPCAVAKNIQTMLVARFFDGVAGAAFLSVAGGTVGDMFPRNELAAPMMVYTASPFIGPEIGPLVGGFINSYTTWRWSFYVLIIWSGAMLAAILVFVPETYHPVLLRHKAQRRRKETGEDRWKAPIEKMHKSIARTVGRSLYRPFMLLILEPMCLNLCLYSAILLGILYLFFGAFNLVFTDNHGFKLWQVGLSFLGLFVGMVAAVLSDPLWHKIYLRLVKKQEQETGEEGASEPEFRLPPAVGGAPLVTIGVFWFAWTLYPSIHWIVPIMASAVFGAGTILVFSGVFTFLVEAYPTYAASALAANSFARSSFAAAFPLFGQQMYHKLGYEWATTLLGFLTLAMAPFPYIFFRYGKAIRQRSKFATDR